ncbi:MAG TPA: homocysteine S-methyltransferase family protein, partial [Solirubrobacterales bacterium]|nr:homocysteine S-methyltransferase family protein [Solirubrobacterales bacterium]
MPHAFSRRLAEAPLLCDGAMGTLLYARGVPMDACFDLLNVNRPQLVQSVHSDYVAAGADCIETNTFGANRFKLAVHGSAGEVRTINLKGVKLARDVRESSGRDVFVLGSLGPLGKYLAPLGTVTAEEAQAAFREQADALLEGGVDGFVVETFSDLAEITLAIQAIRSVTDLPIVAQMAFTDEGVTFTGRSGGEVARALRGLGVAALGANCSVGSSVLYEVLEQMLPEAGGIPLAIQPNAGLPSRVDERLMYLSSPAYMAE